VVAARAHAEASASGRYDITLGVQPGKKADEFLCRVGLRSGESGQIHETEGSFKRSSTGTLRTGEARRDGSAVDLTVEVTVDAPGQRAEFVARVSDRGKIISVQHTTVELSKS
jgi:hypothetical protein